MKKRIVSLLMALVMAVSLLPVSAFAVDATVTAVQAVPVTEQNEDIQTFDATDSCTLKVIGFENAASKVTLKLGYKAVGKRAITYVTDECTAAIDKSADYTNSSGKTLAHISIIVSTGDFLPGYELKSVKFNNVTVEAPSQGASASNTNVDNAFDTGNLLQAKVYYGATDQSYQITWNIKKVQPTEADFAALKDYLTNKGMTIELQFVKEDVMTASVTDATNCSAKYKGKTETGSFRWCLTAKAPSGKVFDCWTWTSEADPTGNNGEKLTENPLTVELTENRAYTAHFIDPFRPQVTTSNSQRGAVDELTYVTATKESATWKVATTPKDWYKLDYVADEAGNQFASTDGKTAQIAVTAADQKFTAYFTSAIAPMYDETNAGSVTVNVTISNDGIPLMGKDGTILANLDVTIPYFDLASYGLEEFYRCGTEFGWGDYVNKDVIERPTALHAYIYLLERYYLGIPESDCGTGKSYLLDYNKATDVLYMDGGLAYNSKRTYALTPTGSATHLYMKTFWGHDENLMYFVNHEYPLMSQGTGSTCDYILLSDGDRLDVGLFTNWDFYKDGGFNQFSQDAYTVMAGETVTTSTFKAGTSAAENGESPELEAIKDLKVAVYDANWNQVADLTGEGTYSYTFTKAGTYYIMGVDANAKTNKAHYAPAITKVTVEGEVDEGGTFILRNANEMLVFQNYVNNGHPDAKAMLGADINMTGIQWSGINNFTGTFDGADHTLTVALTDTGLFNDLAGTVKNLTVAGTVTSGKEYIGAVASNAKGSAVVENCTNKADVTNTKSNGSGYAGGIVGGNLDNSNTAVTIRNCRNYGKITSNYNAGGILGFSSGWQMNSVSITGCENHGIVYSDGRAGGITSVCSNTAEIRQSLNTGAVTGNTGAGGIVAMGSYNGLVEQCVNTGAITSASGEAGGIAGYSSSEIDSCYNTGAVSGNTAGGIVACQFMDQLPNTHNFVTSKVSNCYTTGTVTGTGTNPVTGAAVGWLHSGNIVSVEQTTYRDFQVYALEGTCAQLVGQKSENAKDATAFKTAAELKSDAMLTTLGDAFKKDAGNINNGYPVLVWQVSEACTDHTPGAAVRENEVPATCTKDGSHDEVIYCTVCKTEISRKTITDKATGHKAQAAVKENVKDATCTVAGSHDEVVYCSVCQTEISRTTVTDKALGHNWDSTTGKCKRCETACDHKWTNGKCDTCGYTCQHVGGDAVKEKEVPATCTKDGSHDEVVYCTICKAEVSRKTVTDKALGHKEQPAVKENVKAPTCTADGSHDEVVYCSVCKEEVSRTNVVDKATGHQWGEGVITTLPTTSKEGVKTFTCTVCKETKTESVPKLGEDKKDESAANDAINLINGIGTVTKNSKDKIDAARKAYDGLTEDQKKLVPDSVLKTLTDAEAAYAKLTKPGTKPGNSSDTGSDTKKDDGKTVKSGQTGDAGIVLYAAMGLLSLTGGAWIVGKKKKQD